MTGDAAVPWSEFAAHAPSLAAAAEARFRSHPHHVIATLRRDGSARLNGTNVWFTAGRLWFGMMGGTVRAADLRRDPRAALHSAPLEEQLPAGSGDARVSGRVTVLTPVDARTLLESAVGDGSGADGGDFFELHLESASLVEVHDGQVVVRSWTAAGGEQVRFRS
ncbi:MAG: pyridoxamine 5'-phosphate oxidase family protein [Ilumatobacteraceae bacterium]